MRATTSPAFFILINSGVAGSYGRLDVLSIGVVVVPVSQAVMFQRLLIFAVQSLR